MREIGLMLLAYYNIPAGSLKQTHRPFTDLKFDHLLDAAIVTTGPQNAQLTQLLATGKFRLLQVDDGQLALKRPSFQPFVLRREEYPRVCEIPSQGIATVASTALLAVQTSAGDSLVIRTLETLYRGPAR